AGHRDWDGVVSRAGVFGFRSEGMRRFVRWQNGLSGPDELARARFVEIPALHQCGLYRRAALEAAGGFVGASEERGWPLDIDFWMRWFERGLKAGRRGPRPFRPPPPPPAAAPPTPAPPPPAP